MNFSECIIAFLSEIRNILVNLTFIQYLGNIYLLALLLAISEELGEEMLGCHAEFISASLSRN